MKKILYQSGSIEFSSDPTSWRNLMQKRLIKQYKIINPKAEVCPYSKEEPEYRKWIYDNFVIPDVEHVMKCDHFFIKIDKDTGKGSGSWGELTLAAYLNKHIVYWLDDIKITDIPGWSLGCLMKANEVKDLESAIVYYQNLCGNIKN